MIQTLVFAGILLLGIKSFANLDCRSECTKPDGDCVQLGIRGRASALHLNEMLNAANPKTSLFWGASSCKRHLSVSNDMVSSHGDDCIEWMDPVPGYPAEKDNGTRTLIQGAMQAKVAVEGGEPTVTFDQVNRPNFSLVVKGKVVLGGEVELLSHVPEVAGSSFGPRLLIQTTAACFSID